MPAHEGLTNSFERINILGFAFAPSWVPVAVLSGSLISMVGIFATTRMVWQREVRVLGEDVDAGALKLLIDHWGLRFTTWVVLPTVALRRIDSKAYSS